MTKPINYELLIKANDAAARGAWARLWAAIANGADYRAHLLDWGTAADHAAKARERRAIYR